MEKRLGVMFGRLLVESVRILAAQGVRRTKIYIGFHGQPILVQATVGLRPISHPLRTSRDTETAA